MADTKYSALTAIVPPLLGTEVYGVGIGGASKGLTTKQARDWAIAQDVAPASFPSVDTNNWAPSELDANSVIRMPLSASIALSGISAPAVMARKVLVNTSTNYICVLTHEDANSNAANRFNLGATPFYVMLPGDAAEFWYDTTGARWRFITGTHDGTLNDQFDSFTDCFDGTPSTAVSGNSVGPLAQIFSGTGATVIAGATYGEDTTNHAAGVVECQTGTVSNGRAGLGSGVTTGSTGTSLGIIPTNQGLLLMARLAVQTLSNGTDRYQINFGAHDGLSATAGTILPANGALWRYDDANSALWERAAYNASTATVSTTTGLTVDTNYIVLGIWIRSGWTQADFFHSLHGSTSMVVSGDGPVTTNMPTSAHPVGIACQIIKSVGTNNRQMDVDWIGWRSTQQIAR